MEPVCPGHQAGEKVFSVHPGAKAHKIFQGRGHGRQRLHSCHGKRIPCAARTTKNSSTCRWMNTGRCPKKRNSACRCMRRAISSLTAEDFSTGKQMVSLFFCGKRIYVTESLPGTGNIEVLHTRQIKFNFRNNMCAIP